MSTNYFNNPDRISDNFLARLYVGYTGYNYPVKIVDGDNPPELLGSSSHYTTIGGRPIYHPNAYHWPKVYHHSTLHIEVGMGWLAKQGGMSRLDIYMKYSQNSCMVIPF
jgi:hypothetical protein